MIWFNFILCNLRSANQQLQQKIHKLDQINEMTAAMQTFLNQMNSYMRTNLDEMKQINSSIINGMHETSIKNLENIIKHVDFVNNRIQYTRGQEKPFTGLLYYAKLIGSLQIRSGAKEYNRHNVQNLLELDGYFSTFHSNATAQSNWIEFEFHDLDVQILSYEIQAAPGGQVDDAYYLHPKSWQLAGSNDHIKWDLLDEHINLSSLKEDNSYKYFVCQSQLTKFYRYYRFIQTDEWTGQYEIEMAKFEAYGTIKINQ